MIKYKITSLGKFVSVCAAFAIILLIFFFIPSNDKPKSQKLQTAHSEAVPTAPKANVTAPEIIIPPKVAPTETAENKKKQPLPTKKKYPPPSNKMEISVSFVSDSIVLDERSKRILDAARKKNNFLIVIEGDCTLSTTGNTNLNNLVDKNKELAMKRANAVDEYLIKLGVPKNHIKIISSCERKLQTIKIDEKAAH